TFTGKTSIEKSLSLRPLPVSSENVRLWTGQATFAVPFWSPIMPRDSTNSRRCGHMFCEAYHSPRLATLNTAICVLPYLLVAPPSFGKFHTLPTCTHLVSEVREESALSALTSDF